MTSLLTLWPSIPSSHGFLVSPHNAASYHTGTVGSSTALKWLEREVEQYIHTHTHIHYITLHTQMTHIRVGVENGLLELSYILDFEGKETPTNRILNFLRHINRGVVRKAII